VECLFILEGKFGLHENGQVSKVISAATQADGRCWLKSVQSGIDECSGELSQKQNNRIFTERYTEEEIRARKSENTGGSLGELDSRIT